MQNTLRNTENKEHGDSVIGRGETGTEKHAYEKKKSGGGDSNDNIGGKKAPNRRRFKGLKQASQKKDNPDLSEDEYLVERIIGKKIKHGKVKYLVKWDGYETDEATWEPIDNLATANLAIQQYEKNLKGKELEKDLRRLPVLNQGSIEKPAKQAEKGGQPSKHAATKERDENEPHGENDFWIDNSSRTDVPGKLNDTTGLLNGHTTTHSHKAVDSSGAKMDAKTEHFSVTNHVDNDIRTLREKIKPKTGLAKKISRHQASSSAKNIEEDQSGDYSKGTKKSKKQEVDTKMFVFDDSDLPSFGHFLWDKPRNIANLEYNSKTNDLDAYVHWEPRSDGTIPDPTKIARIDILKYDPAFLAFHYEKSLTIPHLPSINFQNLRKFE